MRTETCDRCKKIIGGKAQPKEIGLMGFHGRIRRVDLCGACAPGFVKLVEGYLLGDKTEKK